MKRIFILVVVASLAVGSAFAEESILIDFSKLTADLSPSEEGLKDDLPENGGDKQNKATLMDFSNGAGNNYTARQAKQMRSSLAIGNWDVVLAPSARNVTTKGLSKTKEATSKEFEKVMGVRIHFPAEHFNSWAIIKPPFEIPAFETSVVGDDGTISEPEAEAEEPAEGEAPAKKLTRFEGAVEGDGDEAQIHAYGVIKNIGTLRSVAVNVYGLNFPHKLSVILIDDKGVEHTMPLGSLNFEGWGELVWNNPSYVANVRNRDLRLYALYPQNQPFYRFGGFLIQKDAAFEGGDFIAYFKDVKIIYDKAVLDEERDIDDEGLWNIIADREAERKRSQMQLFGKLQMERYLEGQRQADLTKSFTPTPGASTQEGETE